MTVRNTVSGLSACVAGLYGSLANVMSRNKDSAIILFLGLLIYFGLFPVVFPYDSQNTYLLNGLAASGYGNLSEDWVSNTKTPFVVFSAIVKFLNDVGFLGGIRLLSFLLTTVFAASCLTIFQRCRPDAEETRSASLMFVLLFSTVALYDQFMLQGMAGQYAMGAFLQPSEFGVFLIASVALFVAGRPIAPYIFVAIAGVFHQSYLLAGAFLIVGYFSYEVFFGKRIKDALIGSVAAVIIVSPVLWYSFAYFSASDAEVMERSRHILAEFRISHHAIPAKWFDADQIKRTVIIGLATGLAYFVDRRLTFVMASAAALGGLASLAALLIDSNALYLLFPWRITVVLVPLSAVVLVVSVVRIVTGGRFARFVTGPWASLAMVLLAMTLSVTSLSMNIAQSSVYETGQGVVGVPEQDREAEYLDLIHYVRANEAPGQLYLHNPEWFFSFRIGSGAAAYVDFKSHPYRDVEVVEWWARWEWALLLYTGHRACDPPLLDEIRDRGITHMILDKVRDNERATTTLNCIAAGEGATLAYDNALYSVIQFAR